jgi:hypothetical protein
MSEAESQGPGGRMGADGNGTGAAHDVGQAFADARQRMAEVSEYLGYYVSAKADGWKAAGTRAGLYGALGLLGGIIGLTIAVTATVMLCLGLAGGLGALFGGRLWLGYLVVSVVILSLLAGGALFAVSYVTRKSKQATVKKYEDRKRNQRIRYGYDVHERAGHGPE